MNKDRRMVCDMTSRVCASYGDEVPPRKTLFAIKESVDEIIELEKRSLKKMEPHREKPTTLANIIRSESCLGLLEVAVDMILEGDMREAARALNDVATENYTTSQADK